MAFPFEQPAANSLMRPHERALREQAPAYLAEIIARGSLGDQEVHGAELFKTGVSSVVYKVFTESGIMVVKMVPEGVDLMGDAAFFLACESAGIAVPHVIACDNPSEKVPVSVMALEYIDAPMLSSASDQERVEGGKLRELGRIQAAMHSIRGTGFGALESGRGKFSTFQEQQEDTGLWERAELLRSKGLLPVSAEEMNHAVELLSQSVAPEATSLTHNDLLPYNVFNTDPLTIFDPVVRYSHPYTCLAMTLIKSLVRDNGAAEAAEIRAGYEEASPVREEELEAAMALRFVHAAYGWERKGKLEEIERLRAALA